MRFRRRPRMTLQRRPVRIRMGRRRLGRRPRMLFRPRRLPRMSNTRTPTPIHRPQINLAAACIRTRINPKRTSVTTMMLAARRGGRCIRWRGRHTQNRTSIALSTRKRPLPPRRASSRWVRRFPRRSDIHHRPHRIARAVAQRRHTGRLGGGKGMHAHAHTRVSRCVWYLPCTAQHRLPDLLQ